MKTKEEREEKTFEQAFCAARMLSLRQNKNSSFPGHAPGKDTLRAANAAMKEGVNGGENGLSEAITRCLPVVLRKGANGGKREGERSERESVVPRQNKDSRRVGGHAPPQRHLKRSVATMKTRFTGRKQNKRKRILLSSRKYHKNPSFPGHAPGKD
ncbi:MAG: hypothetical protein PT943_07055, partial [Ruminococcus sp.]|nr:hypothetical protein [Ruminococcus sp.]